MDAYLWAFLLIGLSMCLNGLNLMTTVITHACARHDLGAPADLRVGRDLDVHPDGSHVTGPARRAPNGECSTAPPTRRSTIASGGGIPYLYENLFLVFGHPEVYILALPTWHRARGDPAVFSRKPLSAVSARCVGDVGVALPSFFVWQHHLFVSGIRVCGPSTC